MRSLLVGLLAVTLATACDEQRKPTSPVVVVHLMDVDSGADIAHTRVVAEPGGVEATTDLSGRARFTGLKAGASYKFTALGTGLVRAGASIVPGAAVAVTSGEVPLEAASLGQEISLYLARVDRQALNLTALHDGRNDAFTSDNCRACHGDRRHEASADPAIRPWHAISAHASSTCTWCHRSVDLVNQSGATLRKQVNVALCVSCHPRFPTYPSSL
jgi:hypothetical protein